MSCFQTFGAQVAFDFHDFDKSWNGWPGESAYYPCDMMYLDGWNWTECFLKRMWVWFSHNIENRVGKGSAVIFVIDLSGTLCC